MSAKEIKVVEAEIPDDANAPIVIQSDQTWAIQPGDRPKAYEVMHRQLANYAKEHGISRAVLKASATGKGMTMKLAHLHASRGVAICALAPVTVVKTITKSYVSRNFGERKADEYLKDNEFWTKEVTGATLRGGSRAAALVILAARQADA